MPRLIKDGALAADTWTVLPADATEVPAQASIVPLALWLAKRDDLLPRVDSIGVWLNGDEDVSQLADDAEQLPLIAVNFPVFTDGRGFTAGRLLRERHGFKGELRAIGYFLRDQMCYLRRCGFNAFSISDEANLESALKALFDFSEYYQASVDQPLPLFRRRA